MTDDASVGEPTATLETTYADAATARVVADAVRPDNTADVDTRVDGATVRTELRRTTTGGLASSVDDYVVNLTVAATVARAADGETDSATDDTQTRHEHDT